MIITVKNLGVIKKAEFDTSKKLTVFCGPNSTGKTYLAYAIYGVLSNMELYDLKSFDVFKSFDPTKKINIKKEYIDEYLLKNSDTCKKNIGEIFGISDEKKEKIFKRFSVNLALSDDEYNESTHDVDIKTFKQYTNSFGIKIAPNWDNELLNDKKVLWNMLLRGVARMRYCHMFPVERNSIYTFKTYLSLNRNQLLDTIFEIQKSPKLTDFIKKSTTRYPLVIQKNLYTAYDLEYIQMRNGELYNLATELENEVLHGTISINQNGEVEYMVKDGVALPISISSSIVKTLSSLIIALKYQVDKGNLLIIDEPEINFHPNNQVVLAQLLAKISNNTPIIVSTHSDYIIRELNNLIVAKSLEKKGNDTYKKYYDKDSLLDYKNVQVLYFDFDKDGKVSVKPLDVDEYGFAVESIDKTIREQNKRTNSLYIEMNKHR